MIVSELFLTEAPIEDLSLVGDWSKASSFRHADDRKLLTNPKAQAKIINKWINTPVPFNISLVNFPGAGRFVEQGEVSHEWLEQNMPKVLPQLKLSDDAVNIIYTNNAGAERVPLTAWVMAHRFGHALQRFQKNREWQEYQTHFRKTLDSILTDAFRQQKPDTTWRGYNSSYEMDKGQPFQQAKLALCQAIGTFRSARQGVVRNVNEFYLEVLAQYIITGAVKFNPVPQSFGFGRMAWGRHTSRAYMSPDMLEDINDEVQMLARDLPYYLEQVMHSAVGRIYVM